MISLLLVDLHQHKTFQILTENDVTEYSHTEDHWRDGKTLGSDAT